MSQMMKLVRVKFVAVFSVLSLVAAFLMSGVVGSTAAQAAAPKELTTLKFKSGTMIPTTSSSSQSYEILGGAVTNEKGTMTLRVKQEGAPPFDVDVEDVKATSTSLTLSFIGIFSKMVLKGSNWGGYSGETEGEVFGKFTFSNVELENPPTPSGAKPRAPKSLKVAGKAKAKSFKVSWKKPSTKGKRPVTGYRVIIKAQGAKKAAVNKKLGKKARSYKVSRKVLLKSLGSMTRGEGSVRFTVRLSALNGNSQSV